MRRLLLAALIGSVACGAPSADRTPTPGDATRAVSAGGANGGTPAATWPSVIGGFLAVENTTTGEALLFRRDTMAMPEHLAAVGYDSVGAAVALRDVRPLPCAARALLRVNGAPAGWSLALDSAHARPVLIDALDDLPHADSQRVVLRIQHALNTLPDSAEALEYRGLPVVVRDAWIVRLPDGPIVVTRAARLRNVEAAAHEELRFVVIQDDQPRYVARVAGDEEVVESWDLLAALSTDRGPVLAIAREGTRSLQLELVARQDSTWRSIWRSDALVCGAGR